MKYIEVTDSPATNTDQTLYRFLIWDDLSLSLDEVSIQYRPTKRHAWRPVEKWSRLSRRDCTMVRPEPSEYVITQAIAQVRNMVRYEGA